MNRPVEVLSASEANARVRFWVCVWRGGTCTNPTDAKSCANRMPIARCPTPRCTRFTGSVLRGITTDPVLMHVPVDDHAFHRGHAVFDTANVIRGKVYGLSPHLDRLLKSCDKARIRPFASKEQLRDIVLATVAAAKQSGNAGVRFWAAAGRGDFSINTAAFA